jgi:hypothetical protein
MVVLAVLALSACSAAAGADEPSSGTGGLIEMAVAETCAEGPDSPCVLVNGENVFLPDAFEEAGVEDASVAGDGQNAVDVTFTADGATVLHEFTEQAVEAGDQARLVLRIGGELQAAVVVMEVLKGDQLQIGLSPDESAQELVDLIRGG